MQRTASPLERMRCVGTIACCVLPLSSRACLLKQLKKTNFRCWRFAVEKDFFSSSPGGPRQHLQFECWLRCMIRCMIRSVLQPDHWITVRWSSTLGDFYLLTGGWPRSLNFNGHSNLGQIPAISKKNQVVWFCQMNRCINMGLLLHHDWQSHGLVRRGPGMAGGPKTTGLTCSVLVTSALRPGHTKEFSQSRRNALKQLKGFFVKSFEKC